jgi:hypothetical protein
MTVITDPIALADQVEAAARDAARFIATAALDPHATVTIGATTPWLASRIQAFHTAHTNGDGLICQHLLGGPGVCFGALWRPGLIVCPACQHALTPDPDEDDRCDRCRRHAPNITPHTATVGPLFLIYALCEPCQHHQFPPPNRHARPRRR